MKRIVLVRHARPESGAYVENGDMPLSDEGRLTHEKVSQELKQQNIIPTKILCSPLKRARQTAEIMSEVFQDIPLETAPFLDGTCHTEEIIEHIQGLEEGEVLFLVGHNPNMTHLANQLGKEKVTEGVHKSGCVIFDFRDTIEFKKGIYVGYIHP